jgi:hypothetical protein
MQNLKVLLRVLCKPSYLILTLLITGLIFTGTVWLPNFLLIVVVSKTASFSEFVSLLFSLYGTITTNFTFVSAVYTILIAVLFGMNVSLLTYYIRRMRSGISSIRNTGVVSMGGLVSGIFGIGCAACGTFIFTSVLTMFGVGGILAYLPFGCGEFGFLGVGLLSYSLYSLTKKINDPLICRID